MKQHLRSCILILLFFVNFVGALQLKASTVEKVADANGQQPARVQIALDQNVQVGDKIFLVNAEQKKIALVQITKVTADQKKALGQVIKGKPTVGLSVQLIANSSAGSKSSHDNLSGKSDSSATVKSASNKMWYGGLFGVSMNTLKTKIAQYSNSVPESASLSGMGFNLKAIVDYKILPDWTLTGVSGLDQFTAKGSITNSYCDNGASQNCKVDIMYLSAEAFVKYNYFADKAWVGLGYGLFFPISYSMNIPSLSKPGLQNTVFISTGYNLKLSPKMTIPVNLHYGLDLVDPSVETSSILIQTGVMFPY